MSECPDGLWLDKGDIFPGALLVVLWFKAFG